MLLDCPPIRAPTTRDWPAAGRRGRRSASSGSGCTGLCWLSADPGP